jgi:hypothetical protein
MTAFGELSRDVLRTSPQISSVLSGVLEIQLQRGDVRAAHELFGLFDALKETIEIQDLAIYRAAGAAIMTTAGEHERALDAAGGVLEFADALGMGQQAVKQAFVCALENALALGDLARADELLTWVEQRPPGLRPPFVEAQARRFRARIGSDDGGLKAAAASFREHDFPFWLAVVELERGEWLIAQGRDEDARAPLEEAREIFARLEAKPWLERLALSVESREPSEVAS